MRIQTNISAMNTNRQIGINNSKIQKSLEKLSSGFAINRASDDAAGLAISEQMRAQINGLGVAEKNAQDAISLAQTAESGLAEIEDIAQRMNELATKGANTTLDAQARTALTQEMTKLNEEIDRIAGGSNFNGINLLDGSFGRTITGTNVTLVGFDKIDASGLKNETATGVLSFSVATGGVITATYDDKNGTVVTETMTQATAPGTGKTAELNFEKLGVKVTLGNTFVPADVITSQVAALATTGNNASFQIGATTGDDQHLEFGIGKIDSTVLKTKDMDLTDATTSRAAMDIAQKAINTVSEARSSIGAFQSRMEHATNNITATKENLSAAESRIRDTDMAAEMIEFTKNSVVAQAAQAMLAQANMQPQSVLQLLQ